MSGAFEREIPGTKTSIVLYRDTVDARNIPPVDLVNITLLAEFTYKAHVSTGLRRFFPSTGHIILWG